jgi:NADPH:quinone reductase-like Zn-dependent oxidoreductase
MQAVQYAAHGGRDVIEYDSVPEPELGRGDVLARVWDGTFEVGVRAVLPTSETARGHELLEPREGFGKVIVVPDSEYDR